MWFSDAISHPLYLLSPLEIRDIGALIGWAPELTGYVFGVMVIVAFIFLLQIVNISLDGTLVIAMLFTGFFVMIDWFPLWVLILLVLAFAIMLFRPLQRVGNVS